MVAIPDFWAVIPAGGAGTRLWPLSRAGSPKFLHDLTGTGRTLLQTTVDRLTPLVEDRVLVVTGAAHSDAVRAQLDLPPTSVLAEPSPRDSMAAIGLAAAILEHRAPDAVMGSFAADHVITDLPVFEECVRTAVEVARDGWLVTIGLTPTHAATGFGYIRQGEVLDGHAGARGAQEFVEKPSSQVAEQYVAAGYLWNAGMFVVRPGVLLDLLAAEHPEMAEGLRRIAAGESGLAATWPHLTRIALDNAVAEPAAAAGRVAVVPGGFGWDDVGDFASLGSLLPQGSPTVLGDAGLVRALDTSGLVVPAGGRVVAVIGLEDVVVVDTGDAVLVTTRDRAQDVKKVVEALKADGRADLT